MLDNMANLCALKYKRYLLAVAKGILARKTGLKRILILMSNTGGGHKASADAIKGGFAQLYGEKYEVK